MVTLHFIIHCYVLLACFPEGIVYIPVQKLTFSILSHNQKICRKRVDIATKIKMAEIKYQQKVARAGDHFYPLIGHQQLQYH